MMMAFDPSQTPPSRLDEATVDGIRVSLREYLATGFSSGLQAALIRMASEARDKAIYPEQVLRVLKDAWYALPEVNAMIDVDERSRLLHRVVTMCIKEYYSV
ncbi:MAG: hypothetical protein ABI625_20285 [bacterium]